MQKYVIALYIRLSIEDYKYDSLSIENQSLVLHEYAASMPEALNAEITEFIDNGYSGTNFERPQVQKLIELVRANQIDCIIVKDFSRFGRNSIETGYFIERVFPLFHTRFISISDDFDSSKFKGDTGGIGQHGTSNPALHSGKCVFFVAGCHICNRDFQFPLHGMTGISLVGFQDIQHITGCPEFLFNGVYKSGQLGLDFFPALLNDLVRSFLLFEINCHRQKHNDRSKDRENQKGRDNQQSNQPSLYPGRRNIGFRGHFNFSGF